MNPEEAQRRAAHAQQLLDDPLLQEAFRAAEEALNRAVRASKNESEAYKAAIACQVFDLVRGAIEGHIQTAKIVEFNFKPTLRERVGL